jgi:hypothetical protein
MRNVWVLLFLCSVTVVNAQQLQFPREAINFTIDSVHFTVDGYYYFKNPTAQEQATSISYPFPNGSKVVDSAWVFDCTKLYNIPFSKGKNDISFKLFVQAKDSTVFRIGYREKHDGKTAHYILTTTKLWNRPLLEASYSLCVPAYITITNFSYKPDTALKQGSNTIYLFRKKDFMPTTDFVFTFICEPKK